jgi:hypothetical protein
MATIGTAFLSEMHVGGRSGSDLIGRGLDPAVPILVQPFTQLVQCSPLLLTARHAELQAWPSLG